MDRIRFYTSSATEKMDAEMKYKDGLYADIVQLYLIDIFKLVFMVKQFYKKPGIRHIDRS